MSTKGSPLDHFREQLPLLRAYPKVVCWHVRGMNDGPSSFKCFGLRLLAQVGSQLLSKRVGPRVGIGKAGRYGVTGRVNSNQ